MQQDTLVEGFCLHSFHARTRATTAGCKKRSDCIHPYNLFKLVFRCLFGPDAVHKTYLLGAMTIFCRSADSVCVWVSLCDIMLFHILYDVYTRVNSALLFFNPSLLPLLCRPLLAAVVAFICVVVFIFSHKVHCNLKKKVFKCFFDLITFPVFSCTFII